VNPEQRYSILRSLMWDYNIPVEQLEDVLSGKKINAGHYNRQLLFVKMLETYPWFTIIQFFTINEIKLMLTDDVIKRLRMPSLRNKYEFVKKRLQQVIPATR
jgi:hypothetical protein